MYSLAEQIVVLNIPSLTLYLHTKVAHLRTLIKPMDKTDWFHMIRNCTKNCHASHSAKTKFPRFLSC